MDVSVIIVPKGYNRGRPYTEIKYTWMENGEIIHALTRVPWVVEDTPHNRARELQEFKQRQANVKRGY